MVPHSYNSLLTTMNRLHLHSKDALFIPNSTLFMLSLVSQVYTNCHIIGYYCVTSQTFAHIKSLVTPTVNVIGIA